MNFELSEDQKEIKTTARDLLTARFRPERLRELAEAETDDDAVMAEVVELGWPAIAVPEGDGGVGLGLVELAAIQEEIGYALAPLPFLSTALAALCLAAVEAGEARDRWLERLLAGEARGAVAFADPTGSAELVPDADGAAFVLFVGDAGATLFEAAALRVAPTPTMDRTRRFASVAPTGPGVEIGLPDARRLRDVASLAVAAESVGVAQRSLEMAVEYAKDREQFGHPIGAYQGVSHRCARMLLTTESARSLTYHAAWTGDEQPQAFPLAAAGAKAYAAEAGWDVPADAVQVHGGIGFTWEHDLHFFVKRGRLNANLYGPGSERLERVAELILLPE